MILVISFIDSVEKEYTPGLPPFTVFNIYYLNGKALLILAADDIV